MLQKYDLDKKLGITFIFYLTPSFYGHLSNMTVMFCGKPHLGF